MGRNTKVPMAFSPLVALAEQVNSTDVEHAVLILRAGDGSREIWPLNSSDPDVLVGLMAWAITTLTADLPDDGDDEG